MGFLQNEDSVLFAAEVSKWVQTEVVPQARATKQQGFVTELTEGLKQLGVQDIGVSAADDPSLASHLAWDTVFSCAKGLGSLGLRAAGLCLESGFGFVGHQQSVWSTWGSESETSMLLIDSDAAWLSVASFQNSQTSSSALAPLGLQGLDWRCGQASWDTGESLDLYIHPSLLMGAIAIGIGIDAMTRAIQYSQDRRQFGKPIASFQAIQFRIADAMTALSGAEQMNRVALGQIGITDTQVAKALIKSLDAAQCATDHAMQIFGGYGYTKEFEVERCYRDCAMLRALCQIETLRSRVGQSIALMNE